MKKTIVSILFITLAFSSQYIPAKILYTWTDKDGVVHITETKPPADVRKIETNNYRTQPKRETKTTADHQKKVPRKNPMMEYDALNKAKKARREAGIARKAMEDAIETANRMKAETDEYVKQWGVRARKRKSIKAKINRKKEATNKAMAEAKRLVEIATQAEVKAREAEKQLADLRQPPGDTGETGVGKPGAQAE